MTVVTLPHVEMHRAKPVDSAVCDVRAVEVGLAALVASFAVNKGWDAQAAFAAEPEESVSDREDERVECCEAAVESATAQSVCQLDSSKGVPTPSMFPPRSRRRVSEADGWIYAAQWLAELSQESESEDETKVVQPAVTFDKNAIRCYRAAECSKLTFDTIQEYQWHLISHCTTRAQRIERARERLHSSRPLTATAPTVKGCNNTASGRRRRSLPVFMKELSLEDPKSDPVLREAAHLPVLHPHLE